jgi:hypothetical protein
MTLDRRVRWLLGLMGIGASAFATALAWNGADGATTAAFLAAGLLLLILAALPRVPSKISFPGGSLEYPVEYLAIREWADTLEHDLGEVLAPEWEEEAKNWPEGTGSGGGPTLDDVREAARNASSAAEVDQALQFARAAAHEQARLVKEIVRIVKAKAKSG